MTLRSISERFGDLPIQETRARTDTYIELVFLNKDLPNWNALLGECLGPPVHGAEARPPAEVRALTSDHGGIVRGQTLYKGDTGEESVLAMLWPWQNGTHTTLKMWTSSEAGALPPSAPGETWRHRLGRLLRAGLRR